MKVSKRDDYDALFSHDHVRWGSDGVCCWGFGSRLLWYFCDALAEIEIKEATHQKGRLQAIVTYPFLTFSDFPMFLGSEILEEEGYSSLFGYPILGARKKKVAAPMAQGEFPKRPFLTSEGRNPKPEHLQLLAHDISPEFQIVYADGSDYSAYARDSITGEIPLGSSPDELGPSPKGKKIYSCPEQREKAICRNAKILSALSDDKHLMISDRVNALHHEGLIAGDLYHPLFLEAGL